MRCWRLIRLRRWRWSRSPGSKRAGPVQAGSPRRWVAPQGRAADRRAPQPRSSASSSGSSAAGFPARPHRSCCSSTTRGISFSMATSASPLTASLLCSLSACRHLRMKTRWKTARGCNSFMSPEALLQTFWSMLMRLGNEDMILRLQNSLQETMSKKLQAGLAGRMAFGGFCKHSWVTNSNAARNPHPCCFDSPILTTTFMWMTALC
mmetsp:Transcript_26638/g.58393  ORF Transcript_26638/g.58393 Transcript_26638/m.58393 type:complete len:207 (+) Transcript_26638:1103-1723(+)